MRVTTRWLWVPGPPKSREIFAKKDHRESTSIFRNYVMKQGTRDDAEKLQDVVDEYQIMIEMTSSQKYKRVKEIAGKHNNICEGKALRQS